MHASHHKARRISRRESNGAEDLLTGLSPLLQRLYTNRGIRSADELSTSLQALIPMDQMAHIDKAVDQIAPALIQGKRILIIGDFDADGATSCALSVLALRAMNPAAATRIDYLVPNRFEYGYGLTPEIVDLAQARSPDLIITVDNGVSSLEGVEAANLAGIPVVVTDHHLPGSELPRAAAIVNPNLVDNAFPSKAMAGVGVIFYVLLALRSHLRDAGWFREQGIQEPNMADYLDLVALGTIADLVPLDRNNRILVAQGLARIRAGRCRPGILALLRSANRSRDRVSAADMGFAVGPRLNAAGRLDDMSVGIECLLAKSQEAASQLAAQLEALNQERRKIESEMQLQAMDVLEQIQLNDQDLPWGLCLYDTDWHQGVIGILASRIKERYHRPTIVFAPAGEGMAKGSARSIPGLHIRDALDEVATTFPHVLSKFGGHAMAAGMTIELDQFPAFQSAFDSVVRRHMSATDMEASYLTDGELKPEMMSLDLTREIFHAGPWGQGFPEPVFDGVFRLISHRIVGDRHWKLVLQAEDNDRYLDAIAFNQVETNPAPLNNRLNLVYRLEENIFRRESSLQLNVLYMEEDRRQD